MAGLSGDLGPAVAERVEQAREAGEGSALHDAIIDMLHTIYDPEIPVDIYELGLIYAVDIQDDAHVQVKMTLTSPNCPAAQSLPGEVETKVGAVPGVASAEVEVVFEPPWTPDLMTEEARLELNLM
ncbi:MAG: SUF system Fe-S cluster assembly protein [Alphaproteobacteria bacterium]|nr:SUF system Fe-S cluster assembly protein [Alphaproteobacteria bacterium]